MDETYIWVGGKWCYLYLALTAGGQTLDVYLSPKRKVAAAKRFLAKTLRETLSAGFPRVISIDKARSSPREWCICPFDKTGSMTISGTGTSPVLRLAHATS